MPQLTLRPETATLLTAEAERRGQEPDDLADALLLRFLTALHDGGKAENAFELVLASQAASDEWGKLPEAERERRRAELREGLASSATGRSRPASVVHEEMRVKYGLAAKPRPEAEIDAEADAIIAKMDAETRAALGF